MNRDPATWVSPIVAIAVLAIVLAQTLGALGVTGAFGWRASAPPTHVSPAYVSLERALDRRDPQFSLAGLRDPFSYGRAPGPAHAVVKAPARLPRPNLPPPPADPVVTAIVWDSDPRALVRWRDREWTVREGGLFDEFQVVSITRDQVLLRRGDATLVLRRRNLGE